VDALVQLIRQRWLQLPAILALAVALGACGGAQETATDSSQAGGATGDATAVTVVATDFRFSLDRAEVGAGTITFVLRNDGSSPHDLKVSGNGVDRKTAAIGRGETARLTVELRPGTYRLVCTVPGHELLGMRGTLTVR